LVWNDGQPAPKIWNDNFKRRERNMSTESTKTIKGRIINKHGTEEYWILSVYTDLTKSALRENPFIPLDGELIIYDPDSVYTHRRIKIGDGVTNVVDLPFIGEGGGEAKAIIDVVELPTENINEDVFYRLLTGTFVFNQFTQNSYTIYCVDALPEVGEPVISGDLTDIENVPKNAYYNVTDSSISAYVTTELSSVFGVPAGWYPANVLMEALGYFYSGIITNILDDPRDDTFRLLLEYVTYSYKEGKWTSHKTIGWTGTGIAAEIFNHPSNIASRECTHAEGYGTTACGYFSHAEGGGSSAEGTSSHAEGADTSAKGYASHAEGSSTVARGDVSHAEGNHSHAEGYASHAEGYGSHAEGSDSHAEGTYSHAEGEASHAEGYYSHAVGYAQHVQGEFNIIDPEYNVDTPYFRAKYAHIVGNGTSENSRSNAHTLDWGGTAWFAGEVKVGGTGQDDKTAKKLATEEYVDAKVGSGGDGKAIIDVVALPTENINESAFYRLTTATFVEQGNRYEQFTVHCVSELPTEGEPVTDFNQSTIIAYLNVNSGTIHGYIDDILSAGLGIPSGWYGEELFQAFDVAYGGVITDISESHNRDGMCVLLEHHMYLYDNGWCEVPFAYERMPEFDITWDGDMTDRIALDMSILGYSSGTYFVKVSDRVLTTDQVIGWTMEAQFNNGDYQSGVINEATYIDTTSYPGAFVIADYIVVVYSEDELATALGIPSGIYTNGIYFWLYTEEGYISGFSSPARITKIDGKYLYLHEDNTNLSAVAFSGSWYDLNYKPDIYTDVIRYNFTQSLDLNEKRRARNNIDVYSKSEVDTKIANVDVDLTGYATEEYVDAKVSEIDLTGYATEEYVDIKVSEIDLTKNIQVEFEKATLPTNIHSVTYGDGRFVAVAYSSDKAVCSTDGINWIETTLPTSSLWESVTYGDGKFVAVAFRSDKAVYSTDGINWIETTLPFTLYWRSVTYGGGKFVAVSNDNDSAFAYSTDGINWESGFLPVGSSWESVTYGDGKFVAVAHNGNKAVCSTDGINWTETTLPISRLWESVAYGDGKFVVVGSGNKAVYSTDGINWTETTLPTSMNCKSVIYGGDKFVVVGGGKAVYSFDGINWTETTLPTSMSLVIYGNNKFVAVSGNRVAYSVDGINWMDNGKATAIIQSNIDITSQVATLIEPHLTITSTYQPKTDDTLTTTDKTVVGAINELNTKLDIQTLTQAVIDALPKYNGEVEDV
jgi:hypothetical protein